MKWVIGIDEVGRGPLAGPVAIGAVALPANLNEWKDWEGLKDSKKLSEKRREEWYEKVSGDNRIIWSVSSSGARIIDSRGIVPAIREATKRAIEKLNLNPKDAVVVLDRGLLVPEIWTQEQFTKGDEQIPAIALASIMAKVTRDKYMISISAEYSLYGFEKHKGYGTKAHMQAIREHGFAEGIHRKTFIHL